MRNPFALLLLGLLFVASFFSPPPVMATDIPQDVGGFELTLAPQPFAAPVFALQTQQDFASCLSQDEEDVGWNCNANSFILLTQISTLSLAPIQLWIDPGRNITEPFHMNKMCLVLRQLSTTPQSFYRCRSHPLLC